MYVCVSIHCMCTYTDACMNIHMCVRACSLCVYALTRESLNQLRPSRWPDGHHGFEALCV